MRNILFIGGTNFIGKELVRRYLLEGNRVYIFSRSKPGITKGNLVYMSGDRQNKNDLTKFKREIEDIEFNIAYDMCCYNQDQALRILPVISSNVKHLVLFSSAAVYKPSNKFPLIESDPIGVHDSFGDYGTNKILAEQAFEKFSKEKKCKLTIFRAHYIIGQNDYFFRDHYFFSRLINNIPIVVPDHGDALTQLAAKDDVVKAFKDIPPMQHDQFEILNLCSDEIYSLRGITEMMAKVSGGRAKIVEGNYAKFGLDAKHFYDKLYPFPNIHLILSNERVKTKYKFVFTPIEKVMRQVFKNSYNKYLQAPQIIDNEKKMLAG